MKIAVVGSGVMGTRVALRSARYGCTVRLVGRDAARARTALDAAAADEGYEPEAARIAVGAELAAVSDADLVYEAIHEDLAAKRALYAALAPLLGADAALVSGTSSFVPAALGAGLGRPVIVAHFLHPVTLVALAELLAPPDADAASVACVERWLARTRMVPVRLAQAVPGFIVNRLQFALLREALALVERGVATAEEIDGIVEQGLGPRWSATGPILSAQLGGWSTFGTIARALVPDLDARAAIPRFAGAPPRALDAEASGRARALRRTVLSAINAERADPLRDA